MKKILFVCTGNSCRSQMAEGLAHHLGGEKVAAFSAGSSPAAHISPGAISVLREKGIDISRQRPKSVTAFTGEHFDLVITLCDSARQSCPFFPGAAARRHWGIRDPHGQDLAAFREARDEIERRLTALLDEENAPGRAGSG